MAFRPSSPAGIVTGAGSGIGQACVRMLVASGTPVLAWDRDSDSLQQYASDPMVTTARVDVTDVESIRTAAASPERREPIRFLINCAGAFLVGPLASVTPSQVRMLFDVNVVGTTLVTQALLGELRQSKGAVVNVASSVALKATASNAHYAASKAAVAHLTRCWAMELGPDGVRVNCVAPGPTATAIYAAAGMSEAEQETLLTQRTASIPLRRIGRVEDSATWILRLAVDDLWTTGAVVPVDGGMSLG
ncbi:ketoreductase [Rhodococcoides trifolii]|uniref:Ketoreductase n=1 Tax=Rhodococcoides trifolii TaxID=908250 RepID=A0A917LJB8_9NOCA|nr:SDR family oxidoreductase [Rhodococcus trifolii]GGG29887.1 ketoreductase [Rhodococcus trifolii]